jgi:formylglycine-generating enzyme required for sulfatase activity
MAGCFNVRGVASAWLMSGGESNPPEGDGSRVSRKELFISYSHKDRAFLEQFWTHLKPLETLCGLQRWDDSRIKPGAIWLEEIEQALSRAHVALLLVSPDFLASDFIQRKELPSLFNAGKQDGLKIVWLPIRPCSWKRYPQIEQFQSVGSLDPTLAEMGEAERDRVMVGITDKIHDLFEGIDHERRSVQQMAEEEALAQLRAEETARLEHLKGENEARTEAERWRAEAERLAREKEEWQWQATFTTPRPSPQPEVPDPKIPPLIQIPATRGWLVREGNEWRKKEESIRVKGYREELSEGVAITMVQIPAGTFLMGSSEVEADREDSEGPQHRVKLQSFFLSQTPVTQVQWEVVASWPAVGMELNPDPSEFKGLNRPVEQVNWEEVMEFCQRLSQRTMRPYTLPSEAQWEYACRSGTRTPFSYGEVFATGLANSIEATPEINPSQRYFDETTDVGIFPANSWGLHDMHGNVFEWCEDYWHDDYLGAPADGHAWLSGCDDDDQKYRLQRGGAWGNTYKSSRSAYRTMDKQSDRSFYVGFRLCGLPVLSDTERSTKIVCSTN